MIIGQRGQVTIPKRLRDKFGLEPSTEVEFVEEQGRLVLRRKSRAEGEQRLRRWVGFLRGEPAEGVDQFVERIRGR